MNRTEIYAVIDNERAYQDSTYKPTEILGSGYTRRDRDIDVTPHLVLLAAYTRKAQDVWLTQGDNVPALRIIAKIAAIAVRALERCADAERLLDEGLR